MNAIKKLYELGQSIWYDNIQRGLLESGELADMIQRGDIYGVTSNPSIFQNAIARTNDYDAALKSMAWAGWSSIDIFYQLAVEDIQAAADLFTPLYQQTHGGDGYVSLEVSPYLANDTQGTIEEVRRLWQRVDRPNLMVKIPATMAGIPAIRAAIAEGINVNVTLIFSLARYALVMDAYMAGLEDRIAKNLPIDHIASVASFFVSRLDSKIDPLLEKIMGSESPASEKAMQTTGKAAVANTRLAYELFQHTFAGSRWDAITAWGGKPQRPLWASTSTKNAAYRDVIYVEELVAPGTVNTVPPQTLVAFKDHGVAANSIAGNEAHAHQVMSALQELGVSMDTVTTELEEEGVKAFADAFTSLLKTIDERRVAARAELGPLQAAVEHQIGNLQAAGIQARLFAHDPTLWTDDPAGQMEIRKRMGWLEAPFTSANLLPQLDVIQKDCLSGKFTHALLLGMGGSSLAPEVLALTFADHPDRMENALDLAILDSTDPDQVRAAAARSPIEKTLFIVSSKSGTTSEVNAFFDYFWALATEQLGERAGDHFIAITDPGTALETSAKQKGFRYVIQADASVGGRNSALIAFGLVPAALLGLDVRRFLTTAQAFASQCAAHMPAGRSPAVVLGAIMGEAALKGRNKLTIWTDEGWSSLGSWLEQLIAESSGKQGKGIVPVDIEPLCRVDGYCDDRLFVYVRATGSMDDKVQQVLKAEHPAIVINVKEPYDLAAEFFRWELATAVACATLGVNSFDQPDVQDNKTRTQKKINTCREQGSLDEGQPIWQSDGMRVYGTPFAGLKEAKSPAEVLAAFLKLARPSDYFAINAYLPRNHETLGHLQLLRCAIQKETCLATTLGFGPRFLHSTGQLHKGGPAGGMFLQITEEKSTDIDIPGEGMTFGTLERAQALGDLEALIARDRRAIRIHLTGASLEDLVQ